MIQKFFHLPYTIMAKFADGHNNTHDYTKMHANAWFVGLILMICVSVLAWRADYEVLYGLDFNSSGDETSAFWKATIFASVIQILILVSGGMFTKIAINGLHRDREHRIQFWIHLGLFTIGFITTLYLSFNTDKAAKAQAFKKAINIEEQKKAALNNVHNHSGKILSDLEIQSRERVQSINAHFDSTITSIRRAWQAKREEKQAQFAAGKITKDLMNQRIKAYSQSEENAVIQNEEKRKKDLDKAYNYLEEEKAKIQSDMRNKDSVQTAHYATLFSELSADIEHNGEATRYKNVLLNFIGFILCVGTLFFARGANAQKPKPTNPPSRNKKEDGDKDKFSSQENSNEEGHNRENGPRISNEEGHNVSLLVSPVEEEEKDTMSPLYENPYKNCGNSPLAHRKNKEYALGGWEDLFPILHTGNNVSLVKKSVEEVEMEDAGNIVPFTRKIQELEDGFEDWETDEVVVVRDGVAVLRYTKRNGEIAYYKPNDIKRMIRTYKKRDGASNEKRVEQWEKRLTRIQELAHG